jgi:hypothetical protein
VNLFEYCTNLTAINVASDHPAYSSVDGVLYEKDKSALLVYPGGKPGDFTIPSGVTVIVGKPFIGSIITAINVDPANTTYSSVDGVLYNKNKTTLLAYPGKKQGAFTIPNSVTSIGSSAFRDCTRLASITIPNSVTRIQRSAFEGCTSLTSVTIPNSITTIEGSTFTGCTSLTSITIPNSVTSLSGFDGCTSLTSITIPNSVTSIGGSAFRGCINLASVTIGNSVKKIEWAAFGNCTNLTSVTFQSTIVLSGFDYSAFQNIGDLRAKFYATDKDNGTPGTYKTTAPVGNSSVWTKQ